MQPDKSKEVRKAPPATPPRPSKNDARPLEEEIENEMIDQDIPVETGVRPGSDKTG